MTIDEVGASNHNNKQQKGAMIPRRRYYAITSPLYALYMYSLVQYFSVHTSLNVRASASLRSTL